MDDRLRRWPSIKASMVERPVNQMTYSTFWMNQIQDDFINDESEKHNVYNYNVFI